jgi:hypothetical protein
LSKRHKSSSQRQKHTGNNGFRSHRFLLMK